MTLCRGSCEPQSEAVPTPKSFPRISSCQTVDPARAAPGAKGTSKRSESMDAALTFVRVARKDSDRPFSFWTTGPPASIESECGVCHAWTVCARLPQRSPFPLPLHTRGIGSCRGIPPLHWLNRSSERIPRRLLRGLASEPKQMESPREVGDSPQFAARSSNHGNVFLQPRSPQLPGTMFRRGMRLSRADPLTQARHTRQ